VISDRFVLHSICLPHTYNLILSRYSVRFKLKYGHCNVPKSADESLHAWVRKQRVNKQLRDRSNGARGLTQAQVEALECLNFDWVVGHASNDAQWNENYQLLLFAASSSSLGHLDSLSTNNANINNNKQLNKWMQNQRARRKLLETKGLGKAKGMTWERVHKLDAIGFRWDGKK
jgi:hypothetical protein